jgi:hypothetical protein
MKKISEHTLIITLFLALAITSCKKECKEEFYDIESLENLYGCTNTRYDIEIDVSDNAVIISSQSSFDSMVEGPCQPTIDFGKYDLIIGKKSTLSQVDTIYYEYKRDCPDQDLVLSIEIIQIPDTPVDNVVFHALIPKLGDEETLFLNVVSTYQQK